jgi:dipeptidyl aminopeptidase/acylaminoacyl peptidase
MTDIKAKIYQILLVGFIIFFGFLSCSILEADSSLIGDFVVYSDLTTPEEGDHPVRLQMFVKYLSSNEEVQLSYFGNTELDDSCDDPYIEFDISPDGEKIIVSSGDNFGLIDENNGVLRIIDLESRKTTDLYGTVSQSIRKSKMKNPEQVLKVSSEEEILFGRNPVWSPDGKKIAFTKVSFPSLGYTDIYIYDVKTKEVRPLELNPFNDSRPQWSEDSKSIYFYTDQRTETRGTVINIWKSDIEGKERIKFGEYSGLISEFGGGTNLISLERSGEESKITKININTGDEVVLKTAFATDGIITITDVNQNKIIFSGWEDEYLNQKHYIYDLNEESVSVLFDNYVGLSLKMR